MAMVIKIRNLTAGEVICIIAIGIVIITAIVVQYAPQ